MIGPLFKTFLEVLDRNGRAFLFLNIILMLTSSYLMSRTPVIFQKFIDSAGKDLMSNDTLILLFLCGSSYFLSSLLRDLQLYTYGFVDKSVSLNLGRNIFPIAMGQEFGNGVSFSDFLINFQSLFTLLIFTLIPTALDILFILFSFKIMFSSRLGVVFLVFILGYILISVFLTNRIGVWQKKFFSMQALSFAQLGTYFQAHKLFKRLNAYDFIPGAYQRTFSDNLDVKLSIGLKRSCLANFVNFWVAVFFITVFAVAIRDLRVSGGSHSLLIPIEAFFFQTLRRLEIFVRAYRDAVNSFLSLKVYAPWILFRGRGEKLFGGCDPMREFQLQQGMTVVYGPTGSGKTTFLNHFFDKEKAKGTRVLYVGQTEDFFKGTLLENLTIGRSVSLPELEHFVKALNLENVVQRLPDGLNTLINYDTHLISGGEKQRFALLRALIRKSELILLDEVTSAQDPQNEDLVLKVVKQRSLVTPVLMVSHSPAAAQIANQVISFGPTDKSNFTEMVKGGTLEPTFTLE